MIRKGRFNKPAAGIAQRYGESVSFDWRLYRYDIAGSIAHAAALTHAGIIAAEELQKIETELRAISAPNETLLNQVPLVKLKKFSPLFDSVVVNIFDVRSALAKRRAVGAPSPENIAGQIRCWRSELRT
jgi:argininosuccinate lyase